MQERSGHVVNAARRLAVIPKGFHEPMTDYRADAHLGATLRREMEEELFGRDDIDTTTGDQRRADPMHPSRLSEPMRWLADEPGRLRMECTGFGLNLMSGNFEFASLIVIDDEEFWTRFGGQIEANWEASTLRQYSSLDRAMLERADHRPGMEQRRIVRLAARTATTEPDRRTPSRRADDRMGDPLVATTGATATPPRTQRTTAAGCSATSSTRPRTCGTAKMSK